MTYELDTFSDNLETFSPQLKHVDGFKLQMFMTLNQQDMILLYYVSEQFKQADICFIK